MSTPEDEAIKIFERLVNRFSALEYDVRLFLPRESAGIDALLKETVEAIRLRFGAQSDHLLEFRRIKIVRKHAKKANRQSYFEQDKHRAIGVLNKILMNLRLGENQPTNDRPMSKSDRVSVEFRQGFVFIAMPMSADDHSLEDVHDTIKTVASEIGLHAERTDDQFTNNRITDRILDSIKSAEYVVADLTYSKPNVYWEAGYAQALDKTPIYIARQGTNIEFDLKDYPVIFFRNMTHLKQELKKRLQGLKSQHGT